MANVIENAKQINELRVTLGDQIKTLREKLGSFTHIMTSVGSAGFRLSAPSTWLTIHFVVSVNDQNLFCHYDVTLNEFIIDECRVTPTFRMMQSLLSDVEIFIRKAINSVE